MARLWIVACCLLMVGCDKTPSPPVVTPPAAVETINGSERIGWDQPAADAVVLAGISYAIYVDGARAVLTGVTCGSAPAAAGFACTGRLPVMSAGAHTLELASFVTDTTVLESARSAPLRVTVVAQSAPVTTAAVALRRGLAWRDDRVSGELDAPADLAFAPDGRLFVAERTAIRIVRDGRLLHEPAIALAETLGARGRLLAIALDPQFARTPYAFAIYTAPARSGEMTFTLARFRAVADTLGDRAVLLEGVPAAANPSAALRFGPDGKLYAAFDDGGEARRRRDAASPNGKVLRLNTDGTTPADASGATPVVMDGIGSPAALDWDPVTATLWVADRLAGGFPFAFYRGALFPAWAGRMISGDVLLDGGTASTPAFIVAGRDGAIYYGIARAVGRLAPVAGP